MRQRRLATACSFLVSCLVMTPAMALAQSAIGGLVTDGTGGVLPGVTVEAASPALIEGSRVAVTDSQGRYLVIELRPGLYTVTFSLPGFTTVAREGIALPADFTATVNTQLRVGSIEETVTVTGTSPVVDVQRTQRQQVLDRDAMDAIPTGRTAAAQGLLVPSIRASAIEVGSSRAMQSTFMNVYGASSDNNTIMVDGLVVQAVGCNGTCFGYYNEQGISEQTFDTAGATAEYSRGGVRVNMIPKDGGNITSGLAYAGGMPSAWSGDNLTQRLKDLGLRSVNPIHRIYDINLTQGGPILQDKLWYFGGYRDWTTDNVVAGSFYKKPDGSPDLSRPGIDDNRLQSVLLRMTWQATPRNKLIGHFDKQFKERFHDHAAGADIETASRHWQYPIYYVSQAKWTATPGSRVLFEAGYVGKVTYRIYHYQPGIEKAAFTPEWYAGASRMDRTLGTTWAAHSGLDSFGDKRFVYLTKLSYVTGSHNLRVGFQSDFGPDRNTRNRNADLYQEYRNGIPDTVLVFNTPVWNEVRLNGDNGFFVQDSWTVDRLTLNGGVRFEWLNESVPAREVGAGRFVPARQFAEVTSVPDWLDISPRFGLAYDLFGSGRTALKFTINRFLEGETTDFALRYNPSALASQRLPWNDLNGDDIAQEGEFNVRLLPTNFGERALSRPDPDIERTWNLLSTVGIDHEVLPGFAVSGAWIRRSYHDLTQSNNVLRSLADYRPITIVNPLTGLPVTVYDLNSQTLLTQVDNFDTNANADLPAGHPFAGLDRSQVYNAFELGYSGRLPGGAMLFGGWTAERTINVDCDSLDDPNTFRFCNQSGLDAESGLEINMPFRHVFKLSGSYPLPYGIRFSGAFLSFDGPAHPVYWVMSRNTTYPNVALMSRVGAPGCVGCEDRVGRRVFSQLNLPSVTVRLDTPGERYQERQNLLSISGMKQFDLRRLQVEVQADLFNALNNDTIMASRTNLATNYGQPTTIMTARYFQLAARVKW